MKRELMNPTTGVASNLAGAIGMVFGVIAIAMWFTNGKGPAAFAGFVALLLLCKWFAGEMAYEHAKQKWRDDVAFDKQVQLQDAINHPHKYATTQPSRKPVAAT